MGDNNIPVLYRAADGERAMREHLLGHLWFRSLEYFRKVEGASRDELEGFVARTLGPQGGQEEYPDLITFPAFIMCFSKQPLPKYGNFGLKLESPHDLAEQVRRRCPERTEVEWCKVIYDKTEHLGAIPNPGEEWRRKHYSKPPHFADEKEWRLIIFLPPPLWLLNDTLKLNVGNLQGLFRYHPITA